MSLLTASFWRSVDFHSPGAHRMSRTHPAVSRVPPRAETAHSGKARRNRDRIAAISIVARRLSQALPNNRAGLRRPVMVYFRRCPSGACVTDLVVHPRSEEPSWPVCFCGSTAGHFGTPFLGGLAGVKANSSLPQGSGRKYKKRVSIPQLAARISTHTAKESSCLRNQVSRSKKPAR